MLIYILGFFSKNCTLLVVMGFGIFCLWEGVLNIHVSSISPLPDNSYCNNP